MNKEEEASKVGTFGRWIVFWGAPMILFAVILWSYNPLARAIGEQKAPYLGLGIAGFRLRLQAANSGNAKAQARLGHMYSEGIGVEQSESEAFIWYQRAANQGVVLAQRNLGIMYARGQGVAPSQVEAVKWLKKASLQGDYQAELMLGLAFADGRGVPQDKIEAAHWLKQAADQGSVEAQSSLARLNGQ
jgi:TPR repeat protein